MRPFLPVAGTLVVAAALLAIPVRPSGVRAGTALRMDVSDLTEHADLIVEARVLGARSFEADGIVQTSYLLEVERTFLGTDLPYRSVTLPGGVLPDGRGMVLAGMPHIVPGEQELLFLSEENATGLRMPVGLAQGKLEVVRHADGSKSLLSDAGGVVLLSKDGSLVQGTGSSSSSYAEVVSEIEASLARRGATGAQR